MRLFAALYPDRGALDHLALALASAHALESRRSDGGPLVRWTPPELWHLTVSFFGDVPEGAVPDLAAAVEPVAADVPPLALRLQGAGVFDRRVLWVGVGGEGADALRDLSAAVAAAAAEAGVRVDRRPRRRAHLTVARAAAGVRQAQRRSRARGQGGDDPLVGDPLAGPAAALAVYAGPGWTAHELRLVESDLGDPSGRPVHRTVRTASLDGQTSLDPRLGRRSD
jgi:2'-5' RNA ligase